jgi:tRNA dimethylallyltransferase
VKPGRITAIIGATATGKTALAIALAQALGGEVVNADSRQVYRGMDIGTAKPTATQRALAPHWLLDVAAPDEQFTLAMFLDGARGALHDITARERVPVVAGGTGQYIWALLEGWQVPRVPPDAALRTELETLAANAGAAAVAARLRAVDPESADSIAPGNVRRMVRAIEVSEATGRPFSAWRAKWGALEATIIGLEIPRQALYERIDARVDAMVAAGLVDEVRGLISQGYDCAVLSMSGIGYRQICEHLGGECSLEDATARIKTETHRLARMQHTWFRRDDGRIRWLDASAPDVRERALSVVLEED